MSTYDNGTAWLVDAVKKAMPTAIVQASNGMSLQEFLDGQTRMGQGRGAIFVNYEGWDNDRNSESGLRYPTLLFSIYYHGRDGDGEAKMLSIANEIGKVGRSTLSNHQRTFTAMCVSGRYMLLTRGYDTYQLDVALVS